MGFALFSVPFPLFALDFMVIRCLNHMQHLFLVYLIGLHLFMIFVRSLSTVFLLSENSRSFFFSELVFSKELLFAIRFNI